MSTPGSTLMGCPDVQAELNAYFETCDAATRGFGSPFNEFLWSDMNRSGLQQQINPAEGKLRTVILRYDQAIPAADTKSYADDFECVSTTKRGDLSKSYTFDPDVIVEENELMNADDWFDTCRSNPEIILQKIAALMKSVREGTYKKTAEEFVNGAMWGSWGQLAIDAYGIDPSDQELDVKTHKDNSIDIYPTTMQRIKNAQAMTGYCAPAFITGGITLYEYWQLMQAGCCSSQGLDLGAIFNQFGMAVTWDKYLQQAFADADMSISLQPRSLQLIYFNRFASKAGVDKALNKGSGAYDKFVINDPISGMPMNILIADNCPGNISISVHTSTQLVNMPYDIYGTGDDLEGVTYVNKIHVENVG